MELVVLVSHSKNVSLRVLIIGTYSNDFSTLMTRTSIYTSAINEQFAFSWQPYIHSPAVHTMKDVYKNRHIIGFIYSVYSVSCKTDIQIPKHADCKISFMIKPTFFFSFF